MLAQMLFDTVTSMWSGCVGSYRDLCCRTSSIIASVLSPLNNLLGMIVESCWALTGIIIRTIDTDYQ